LGSNALAVGGNNLSTEVSGTIADGGASGGTGGSLVKVGNGILLLSGVNTYTGTTTVNSGALIVNGSIASSSLTTVNSGAVLLGSGTVGSTVVNAGGVLVPGAVRMPSSMTVAGDLIIQQCFLCRAGESVDGVAHHCDRHRVAGRHRRGRLLPGHLSRAQLHHFDGRQPAHRQVRRFGDVRPAAQLQGQAGLVGNTVELNLRAQLIGDGDLFPGRPILLPSIPGLPLPPEDLPGSALPPFTSNQINAGRPIDNFFNNGGTTVAAGSAGTDPPQPGWPPMAGLR